MSKEDESFLIKIYQDLKWVLESPSLLSSQFFANDTINLNPESDFLQRLRNYFHPILKSQSLPIDQVLEFFQSRTTNRLGKYYEHLLEFLFIQFPEVDLISKGLPLREDHAKTIGEFDFILFDWSNLNFIHMEVAVKFYLKLKHENLSSSFIGPSFNDRLDKKMDKLKKQISLSQSSQGFELLQEIISHWLKEGISQLLEGVEKNPKKETKLKNLKAISQIKNPTIHKYVLIQGRLFYSQDEILIFPDALNPNHNRSFYLQLAHLDSLKKFARKFLILPRLNWLSDPSRRLWSNAVYYKGFRNQVQDQLAKHNSSVYIMAKDWNGTIFSFFVLPDSISHLPL